MEITPAAGDVVFYDIFCPHGGSSNLSAEPRIALNQKWGAPLQHRARDMIVSIT